LIKASAAESALRMNIIISIIYFLFSLRALPAETQKENKFFYIYEWHKDLDDVWPPAGAKLHPKSGYNHDFRDNYGSGKLLDEDVGLFQTWQFSLYKVVMSRLRVSQYRTRSDPL
jgi:hypothetical protein